MALGDVWILTIPGFHWFKVESQTEPRNAHACALVGKRQMLVVGGLAVANNLTQPEETWEQGIGILDLPTTTWSSSYDSEADDYVSPDIVQKWYSDG